MELVFNEERENQLKGFVGNYSNTEEACEAQSKAIKHLINEVLELRGHLSVMTHRINELLKK